MASKTRVVDTRTDPSRIRNESYHRVLEEFGKDQEITWRRREEIGAGVRFNTVEVPVSDLLKIIFKSEARLSRIAHLNAKLLELTKQDPIVRNRQ